MATSSENCRYTLTMGDPEASERRTTDTIVASGRRRSWPLQADFIAVGLVVIVVGAAAGAFVYVQSQSAARQAALADANFAAQRAAAQLQQTFDVLQGASAPTANNPAVGQIFANGSKCTLTYAPIGAFDKGHLDIVRLDGSVVCSSLKAAPAWTYAGQSWLHASTPAVVGPTVDSADGAQVALYAYPIPGRGFLVWFLDLTPLGPNLAAAYGSGTHKLEFLVTSSDGSSIISRSVDSAQWTGTPLSGTPFARAVDPVDRSDVTGTVRWYGQANVKAAAWIVYVGADKGAALADAQRLWTQEVEIVAAGALFVLLALFITYRRVVKPIEELRRSVRLSRGLDSPTFVPVGGPSEVADLGEDINHLITTLNREWTQRENAQQTYLRLFEGNPLPILFVDPPTGKFLEANDSAATAFGYSRQELVGMTIADLIAPKDEEEAAQVAAARLDPSHVRFGPVSLRKKDGALMRTLVTTYQVPFGGRPARVSMVEDITEKEKLERQFIQSQRLESLGQLAGGIAHDFNNLLGVILNFSLFAKEKMSASGNGTSANDARLAVSDLERVVRAAESAARLTHQLLAFARREVIRPRPLNVNLVVGELEPLLRRTLGEHIDFVTPQNAALWPALMDQGQLEQVLTNLAVNARDAMPRGGTLTIDCDNVDVDPTFAAGRPGVKLGRNVRIRVTDTGTGMDSKTLQRVFEPFFTTKPKGQGTGLGLATVYGIIKQAGGDISIYSELGVGTRVQVLLPASDAAPKPAEPDATSPRVHISGTILVVEDADDLREVTSRILTKNGYDVITAPNGSEALEVAKKHRGSIDLLLTDVVMPGMQGNELAVRMTALWPGVRVLYMSGYAQPILGDGGTLDDDVQLVEKPFTEPVLLAKVDRVLSAPALIGA
jgi:PAS domain S-box-containing protein